MNFSKVELHEAKRVCDYFGNIYHQDVLKEVDIGDIVRISFSVNDHCFDSWSHDAPYIEIVKKDASIDSEEIYFIGEIHEFKRESTDMYPISVGERMYFKKSNIIEIPLNIQKNSIDRFEKFLIDEKLPITGPLYTIVSDNDSLYKNLNSDSNSSDGSSVGSSDGSSKGVNGSSDGVSDSSFASDSD